MHDLIRALIFHRNIRTQHDSLSFYPLRPDALDLFFLTLDLFFWIVWRFILEQ